MNAKPKLAPKIRRKKLALGNVRGDASLGHEVQQTSSHEGAKEGGKLPSGWKWKTIPDLITDEGVFIDGDWVESKDQDPNGDVRLIQLADVGDGVYRDKSDRFMTKGKADELRCTFLKVGDVLVARMPDPLGRACIFPGDAKPSVTVVDVAIVRSGNGEFDHRWLACFVNAHPFRSAISGLQAGSTRKRISRGNLATIPLPVPPLPEQRRIVAEIEKQFTRLEAGVAALRRVQANLKRYRAAVLKAACEGRLVPTEAELARTGNRKAKFESGEALLGRILDERRRNWIGRGKYKEPARPEPLANVELPEGWVWTGFDQLADGTKNAIKAGPFGSSLKKSFYTPSGFKIYGQEQVIKGDPYFGDYFISLQLFEQLQSCQVKAGDILISLVGTTGKVLILPDDCAQGIINPRLVKLSLNHSGVNPKFIKILLESVTTRAFFRLAAHGGTMEILNLGILKTLPIALPPFAEQTRIVAEVERRLSVLKELEAAVSANIQRATRLRQAILGAAFSGGITRQRNCGGRSREYASTPRKRVEAT